MPEKLLPLSIFELNYKNLQRHQLQKRETREENQYAIQLDVLRAYCVLHTRVITTCMFSC